MAWLPDASGFAYTRYPDPAEVGGEESGYHRTVWWHRIGDPPGDDAPCFTDLPDKEAWPEVELSHDGRWLLVHLERGWSRTDIHLLNHATGEWSTIVEGIEASTWLRVDSDRDRLVGQTTIDAPKGRLVALPIEGHPGRREATPERPTVDPRPQITDLVPEGEDVLTAFALAGDHILALRTRAGLSSLHHHTRPTGGTWLTSAR